MADVPPSCAAFKTKSPAALVAVTSSSPAASQSQSQSVGAFGPNGGGGGALLASFPGSGNTWARMLIEARVELSLRDTLPVVVVSHTEHGTFTRRMSPAHSTSAIAYRHYVVSQPSAVQVSATNESISLSLFFDVRLDDASSATTT